jgi:hypothetical protein
MSPPMIGVDHCTGGDAGGFETRPYARIQFAQRADAREWKRS